VPKSYKDCNKISNYPTTPLKVTPFQQPYKQAAVKQKSGSTCNGDSCLDVYEIDEVYVPNHELLPSSTCPNGTKMLLSMTECSLAPRWFSQLATRCARPHLDVPCLRTLMHAFRLQR
jgi:hypothetical protein